MWDEHEMKHLIVDFDSTFVKVEALDCLAGIALAQNPEKEKILEELSRITVLGMEGKIPFDESLSRRLKMFSARKKHISQLIRLLKKNISDSIEANRDFFVENADRIYIISGGFEDYIIPVVEDFEISPAHVIANKFIFDQKGNVIGVDDTRALSKNNGKVQAIRQLDLGKNVWVIGDGFTDYQIKEAGCAEMFCAFCENVQRKVVLQKADIKISNFSELRQLLYA